MERVSKLSVYCCMKREKCGVLKLPQNNFCYFGLALTRLWRSLQAVSKVKGSVRVGASPCMGYLAGRI